MTHLPPLARFRYVPESAVHQPFDALADEFRRARADVQLGLDACVAVEDGARALVDLAKLYLSLHGNPPHREAIERVLPLRAIAKARASAGDE